jgi:hypothetical protein
LKIIHVCSDAHWFQEHFEYLLGVTGHTGETLMENPHTLAVKMGKPPGNISIKEWGNVWTLYADYFDSFDAAFVSIVDAWALPFLLNNWTKPLYIWLSFKHDADILGEEWSEYNAILRAAKQKPNVKFLALNDMDRHYIQMPSKLGPDFSVDLAPPFWFKNMAGKEKKPIVQNKLYVYGRHNENLVLPNLIKEGIDFYRHEWNQGAIDLTGIKGMIHFPYQAHPRSFYENMALTNIYFLPTVNFQKDLILEGCRKNDGYFWDNFGELWHNFHKTEWYKPEHAQFFVYFSSFRELKQISELANLDAMIEEKKRNLKAFAERHNLDALKKWKEILS